MSKGTLIKQALMGLHLPKMPPFDYMDDANHVFEEAELVAKRKRITVNYTKSSLEEMIQAGQFTSVDQKINSCRFPKDPKQAVNKSVRVSIFSLNPYYYASDAIKRIQQYGLHPANIFELLAFVKIFINRNPKDAYVNGTAIAVPYASNNGLVALGSPIAIKEEIYPKVRSYNTWRALMTQSYFGHLSYALVVWP